MKATVIFACDCQQSRVEALIERSTDGAEAGRLLFGQPGRQSVALAGGAYDVAYRAQGTPRTTFSLRVVEGGTMRVVEQVMPQEGEAAGVRRLVVVARLLTLPLLLLAGHSASAQTPGDLRRQTERLLATVPNVSDVLLPGYYLALEAGSDSKAGTGTVAVENGRGSFSGSLSFSGPLDRTSTTRLPRKLDGLPPGGTLKIALHWFHWPAQPDVAAMALLCEQEVHRRDCDDSEIADRDARDRFIRLAHSGDAPLIASIETIVGRQAFHYLEHGTLTAGSQAHTNWAGGFAAGRFAPQLGYIALEFEHQEQFQAGDATDVCESISPDAVACRTVVVGQPTRHRLDIGGVEWRAFFRGGGFAVNPSLSHDFRTGVSAFDLPFYFLTLSTSALAGGARASYRTDTRDIAVSLFLGASLRPTP